MLDILDDSKALPSLRLVSANRSYLGECFGDEYPSTELCEDLVQEAVNAKSDDIKCVISGIKRFEIRQDELTRSIPYKHDSTFQDLHVAKVGALQAEIALIQGVHITIFTSHDRNINHNRANKEAGMQLSLPRLYGQRNGYRSLMQRQATWKS